MFKRNVNEVAEEEFEETGPAEMRQGQTAL